jgi:hypothetical protein
MHPWLAFLCFFRLLFGRKLPAEAARFLPEDVQPKQLPETTGRPAEQAADKAGKPGDKIVDKPADKTGDKPATDKLVERPAEKPKVAVAQHQRDGALALLALLQREGRFVDFVRDSVDGASDADIGAAAREVHRGCRKVLDQHLSIEPVMPGAEEAKVDVPKGFDPAEVRLIGEAKGEPPFRGTLRHHGWRVVDAKLPTLAEGVDRAVIAPAEVELSS